MAHLLTRLLDPLGLLDSDDIREIMTAAATEGAAKDEEVTAQSAKEFFRAVMEGDVKRVAEALKKNKGFVNNFIFCIVKNASRYMIYHSQCAT